MLSLRVGPEIDDVYDVDHAVQRRATVGEHNMHIGEIAAIAHAINRAYCEALGDTSQPEWDKAPQWQRDSAFDGVLFHINNPDAGPEASHENWLKQKEAEGWKYGSVKNPETKEHPCFVPYNELPVEQRAKDYLFRQVVHSLTPFVPENQRPFKNHRDVVQK